LTSPQAMNPLPNRPLLSNPSLPLSLPNVPSFDQMPYNGRPRKAMPELPKEFPQMGNMGSAPPSMHASQINALDRGVQQQQQTQQQQQPSAGPSGPQSQQQEQQNQLTQTQPPQQQQLPPQLQPQSIERERNHDDIEPQQLTAIFRPDDAGEWKERLRLTREAAERDGRERMGEPPSSMGGAASWERGGPYDEHGGGKEVDEEDDEESTTNFGEGSETDGAKLWKAKRTLRK